MDTIAHRFAALRAAKQLSQRKLAELCGVSQPTIANIERGRTTEIKGYVLEALAKELSTTSDYILHGVDNDLDHEYVMMTAELAALFRELSTEDRYAVLRTARGMHQNAKSHPHGPMAVKKASQATPAKKKTVAIGR